MELTAEQIQANWDKLMEYIELYITGDRKQKLLDFYTKYEDRLILMPAAHKREYHNAFPGGYIDHVLRVVECSLNVNDVWVQQGVDTSTYTLEELVFSAINHDLGKMGDETGEAYLPNTDKWRKEKLGEDYMFNNNLAFTSVPDRGLYMLQAHGVQYNLNEMIAIQTHDGLYDVANEKYLKAWRPEQRPRTALPYILHQGDLMAARIEWEREWLPQLQNSVTKQEDNFTLGTAPKDLPKKTKAKDKALKDLGTDSMMNMLKNL